MSDKINFKLKIIKGDKENPFTLIKETLNQEAITNIYMLKLCGTQFHKTSTTRL